MLAKLFAYFVSVDTMVISAYIKTAVYTENSSLEGLIILNPSNRFVG